MMPSAKPFSSMGAILKVGGITPFTATDYPGMLASAIFVQGCPWRCGYCHNPHLQTRTRTSPIIWSDAMALLQRRVGLIDAVVFSGGEPTMDPGLAEAIKQVRELGFKVGLHTGGTHPQRLIDILPMLDWVGIDIKTTFSDYAKVTHVENSGTPALRSLQAVLASKVQHECRSTVHPALQSNQQLLSLGQELAKLGVTNYAVQTFRAQGCNDPDLKQSMQNNYPCPDVLAKLNTLFPRFVLRQN